MGQWGDVCGLGRPSDQAGRRIFAGREPTVDEVRRRRAIRHSGPRNRRGIWLEGADIRLEQAVDLLRPEVVEFADQLLLGGGGEGLGR